MKATRSRPRDGAPSSGTMTATELEIAWTASPCGRPVSEDFFDFTAPGGNGSLGNNFAIALADGVTAPGNRGREAAESCVRTVLSDYMATPAPLTPAQTLERSARSVNSWLFSANNRGTGSGNMLCTFTALAFRDGTAHFAHVGDSRLYRIREGKLERLTADHVWPCAGMQHLLRRAIGLDRHLVLDCGTHDTNPGDVFMLLTDGVWEVIGESGISSAFRNNQGITDIANDLVTRSIDLQKTYVGRNDATAILLRVLN